MFEWQDAETEGVRIVKVSIITPAYNAAETIAATLDSIIAQTYPDWEAIVINDGSTDETALSVQEFLKRDPRIRMIQQPHGGEAAARNAGFHMAGHEWLLFLDADDWISPIHLERMTDELLFHPELDAVHCGSARVAPDGTQVIEKFSPPDGDLFPILAHRAAFPIHACIVRKSLVELVGRFDTALVKSPDWDLWQRIARTGARFGAVREVLSFYRMRPDAASMDACQMLKDGLRVLRQGHAPDPRVPNPDPRYVNGMPPEEIPLREFYLVCWCAGLSIGAGKDARPLLELVKDDQNPQLYPDAVAQCLFESTLLPTCRPPNHWMELAPRVLENIEEFLASLELQTKTPNLAKRACLKLKEMILTESPTWNPVIQDHENGRQEMERELGIRQEVAEQREKERDDWQRTAEDREKWRIHWQETAAQSEKERDDWQRIAEERERWRIHWEEVSAEQGKERDNWQKIAEEREKWRLHWEKIAGDQEKERNDLGQKVNDLESAYLALQKKRWVRLGVILRLLKVPSSEQTSTKLEETKVAEDTKHFHISAIPVLAILVSVLQGLFFLLDGGRSVFQVFAIGLSATTVLIATAFLVADKRGYLYFAVILYAVQLGTLVFRLAGGEPSVAPRLLQVALLLFHFAIVLSVLLGEPEIVPRRKAILLSFSFCIALFLSEIMLGRLHHVPSANSVKIPQWSGKMDAHPALGAVFPPNSVFYTYYPGNPRGYFKEDPRVKVWLRLGDAASAVLLFPPDNPGVIRVVPQKLSSTASDIQLNMPNLKVNAKHRYTIRFRARADTPRKITYGFAKAHDPWTGLGFYRTIDLTKEWKIFDEEFVATGDDDNARIHFDTGNQMDAVEFSSIELRSLPGGATVEPKNPFKKFLVSYRFNSLGCRGPDYSIPRSPDTERILLLGDSYTLGSGVYESDTLGSRLQQFLNEKFHSGTSPRVYETINCGVSGYGTREERLFYELYGAKYEPQIVVLTMVWNDDIAFADELKNKYVERTPSELELIFYTWAKIQDIRYRHPDPDFTKNVEQILRLDAEIRKRGGRLAVVFFRNNSDFTGIYSQGRIWNLLIKTITKGLQGKQIPILDLGKALFEKHSDDDLQVYPEVDSHPNEIAHAIAAREILNFLQNQKLVGP